MVGVDRIELAQLEDRLCVEGEGIGLQPVDRGDRNPVRPLLGRRCTARAGRRASRARDRRARGPAAPAAMSRGRPPVIASSRSQKREARSATRRRAVRGSSALRRAQRAGEIMCGKPDAEIQPANQASARTFGGQPRIRGRQRRPDAFVEPAEDQQIGLLQPRFEQAPDENARMPTVRRPNRARIEHLPQQRHRSSAVSARGRAHAKPPVRRSDQRPCARPGPPGAVAAQGRAPLRKGGRRAAASVRGSRSRPSMSGANRPDALPRPAPLLGEKQVEPDQPAGWTWPSKPRSSARTCSSHARRSSPSPPTSGCLRSASNGTGASSSAAAAAMSEEKRAPRRPWTRAARRCRPPV